MERRTFVQGLFGLTVLAAAGGAGAVAVSRQGGQFVTPEVKSPEAADGPVMRAGIELAPIGDGAYQADAEGTALFQVDELGAQLVRMADGSRTLDQLAAALGTPVKVADVASFFVTLGQAGYLANTVYVNLVEHVA